MSAILREFADAVRGYDGHYETGTLINEIADVLQESEPPRSYDDEEEEDDDDLPA